MDVGSHDSLTGGSGDDTVHTGALATLGGAYAGGSGNDTFDVTHSATLSTALSGFEAVTLGTDGTVQIPAGTDVKVKLTIVVPDHADFVAIDDPLPAGLEALNPAFESQRVPRGEDGDSMPVRDFGWGWRWHWTPFHHTELRDDRVLLFADRLPAGVYTHTYLARATTKGSFQVPPARALEMYAPERFGRNASTVVEVR